MIWKEIRRTIWWIFDWRVKNHMKNKHDDDNKSNWKYSKINPFSLAPLLFIFSIANLPFVYGRRCLCMEWKRHQWQRKYSRIHPMPAKITTHGIGLWCSTIRRWEHTQPKGTVGFGVWIASSPGQSVQTIPTNIRDLDSWRQMENCTRLLPHSRFNVPAV